MTVAHKANKEERGGEVNQLTLLVLFIVGALLWITPHPADISQQAWHLFVIFLCTIMGIIFRPMPVSATVLVGMVMAAITGTVTSEQLFLAYGKNSVWLILMSFFLARGLVKTGLAVRISYYFIRLLGKYTLGLVYGIGASEFCLATVIPSLVARSGGVIYPILLATTENLKKDHPNTSVEKTCGFLMVAGFQIATICSALFITSMAANPLIVEIAEEFNLTITWGTWALGSIVPGIASLVVVPWVLYKMIDIEVKHTPQAAELANEKLKEMGKITKKEKIMMGTFGIVLSLWIFGSHIGVNSVVAAMFGVSLLLMSGVLTWKDCISEETAWSTLFWLGGLIAMGTALKSLGLFAWLSQSLVGVVGTLDWTWGVLALALFYFYSHYLFASNTAHVTSMYSAFLLAAVMIGAPGMLAALVLGYFSNLFGGLTHYSNGPAPIFYASHYLSLQKWWYYGFVVSVVNILIWTIIGGAWWKLIGIW